MFARFCVEVNVAESLPSRVWIDSSKDEGYWQYIEYEENIAYCVGYGGIGHKQDECRQHLKRGSNPPPIDPNLQPHKDKEGNAEDSKTKDKGDNLEFKKSKKTADTNVVKRNKQDIKGHQTPVKKKM